jgi:hypothetical protein
MPGWRAIFKRDGKVIEKEIVFWVIRQLPDRSDGDKSGLPDKTVTEGVVLISDIEFGRVTSQSGFLGYAVPGEGLTRFQHALKGEAS